MRCKLVSKIKKIVIEIKVVEAKNIKVTCKLFMVSTRVSGRYALVASINGNCELPWLHKNAPGAPVREAINSFMEEMEHGHDGTRDVHRKFVRGIGPTKYPKPTKDVTSQPEFIPLQLSREIHSIQTIRSNAKIHDFIAEVDNVEFDVLFITQTWRTQTRQSTETSRGHNFFLSGGDGHSGVGISVSKKCS